MKSYIVYKVTTGEILRGGSCQEASISEQANDLDELAVETPSEANDLTEYYHQGQVAPRPTLSLQHSALVINTTETLSITNIPTGTTVTHPDGSVVVNDGFIDWSCVEPGVYEFSFENFPYVPEVLSATVISA